MENANRDLDFTGGDCQAGDGEDTIFVPAGDYQIVGNGGNIQFLDSDLTTLIGDGVGVTKISWPGNGGFFTYDPDKFNPGIFGTERTKGKLVGMTIGPHPSTNNIGTFGELELRNVRCTGGNSNLVVNQGGGGCAQNFGILRIYDSLLDDNHAVNGRGGAIATNGNGSTLIVNTTITNNTANGTGGRGGGVNAGVFGPTTLINVTVTGNSATTSGGGVQGKVAFRNSIISGNTTTSGTQIDCSGFAPGFGSLGYNVVGPAGNCVVEANDVTGFFSVVAGTLADNGGQTKTHLLLPASIAVDLIPTGSSDCDDPSGPITGDQRDAPRGVLSCDAGSVEGFAFFADTDSDNDGVLDVNDNCPFNANAGQGDSDSNGRGDACDPGATLSCGGPDPTPPDGDGDGVPDVDDNCPLNANPNQEDFDGDGIGDVCDPDVDGDGVDNAGDVCAATVIPEGVPTLRLNPNRWALTNGDTVFDTISKGRGNGPGRSYTTTDTAGCSCEQIILELGLGQGHAKFGCSISAMDDWVALVNP